MCETKMNKAVLAGFFIAIISNSCTAQRSPYAGRAPIGYPALATTTTTVDPLGNRFGDDASSTTIRLPVEALGDVDFYNRMLKLPIDKQPFWLINWQALEANRKNPQTYSQKHNTFIDTNAFNVQG